MGDTSDKSVLGRKVFFVNPSFSIENTIVDRLRTMEYEVYVISDFRMAKNAFLLHKDCICYIFIDAGLSHDGWKNYISSLNNDSLFEGIDVGVISENIVEQKKPDFEKDLRLNGGFYSMLGTEVTLREIVKSLDKLEAKGMRKYVRVSCMEDKKAELFWITKDTKMFRLKLIDISAVGIAAKLPASQANAVFVNQLISDGKLILGSSQVPIVAKVTAVKAASDFLLVVLMFTVDTDKSSLESIRAYVSNTIQQNLEFSLRGYTPDKVNYEIAAKKEE